MPTLSHFAALSGALALAAALGCATSPSVSTPRAAAARPVAPAPPVAPVAPVQPATIGTYLDRQLGELQGVAGSFAVERRSDALVVSLESDGLFGEKGTE